MRVCPSALRLASGWIAVAVFGWSVAAQARETPLTVTYAPAAGTAEGDPDHREVLFVPEGIQERIYPRVFDPETGGDHDLVYGAEDDTEVRYTLFGGEGAYTALTGTAAGPEQLAGGESLGERLVGANPALDSRWQTLFAVAPEEGEAVDGRRVFRLQVEGVSGNDANLYAATLSLRERRNLAPDGLEIAGLAPTVRCRICAI